MATCKQRDAAPVLFDRGASAPGAVRRLDCLNAKLAGVNLALPQFLNAAKHGIDVFLTENLCFEFVIVHARFVRPTQ